jgi:hypothetical protein
MKCKYAAKAAQALAEMRDTDDEEGSDDLEKDEKDEENGGKGEGIQRKKTNRSQADRQSLARVVTSKSQHHVF